MTGEASFAGPLHDLTVPGRAGAEKSLGRADAGTAEVESVGVPADPDAEVTGDEAIGVGFAGMGEELQLPFTQGDESLFVALAGQLGTPGAVIGVEGLILPSRIVKHGEELHNGEVSVGAFSQQTPIFEYTGPVGEAVAAFQGLGILVNDGLDQSF